MNLPILIVIFRGLGTIPVVALIALARPQTDAAALAIFVVAVLTDAVDGRLARARGEVTALGAQLDPLADKILVIGALGALAARGLVPLWALAIVVARELAAVSLRARSRTSLPATTDGKAKTALQAVAAATTMLAAASRSPELAGVAGTLVIAAVALTVLSGVRLVLRAS